MNIICQDCGQECHEWEILMVPDTEIWGYCEDCDTETFHRIE